MKVKVVAVPPAKTGTVWLQQTGGYSFTHAPLRALDRTPKARQVALGATLSCQGARPGEAVIIKLSRCSKTCIDERRDGAAEAHLQAEAEEQAREKAALANNNTTATNNNIRCLVPES